MPGSYIISSSSTLAIFQLWVSVVGAGAVATMALFYFRRFRLERPPIGTFNGRDIVVLFVLISTLPQLYLLFPRWMMTSLLAVTFIASLSIGYKPVLRPATLWVCIGMLLGLNIWLGNNLLGTVSGWQVYWVENSVIVGLAAVAVSNLYAQGGMKFKHAAWFAFALSAYDVFFTAVLPVTNELVQELLGYPLDPSIGFRLEFNNATIGLGDLLVYGLFTITAFKAYGRAAARMAIAVVVLFGAVVPAVVPLIINYVDSRTDVLVPAQLWFGPAAFITYLVMRRKYGRERTMKEFLASDDVVKRPDTAAGPAQPKPAAGEPKPVVAEPEPVAAGTPGADAANAKADAPAATSQPADATA